jgi:hypothetical protein
MRHEFHIAIREILSRLDTKEYRFLWDDACGGSARLPLFRNSENRRHMWYTCPDAILHDSSAVRLIVEIEEAGEGFRPGHLFGKFYSATHARFLITRVGLTLRLSQVTFIQVVNTCALKAKSRKGKQYENIEADIREDLPRHDISAYHLIAGNSNEFAHGKQGEQLCSIVGALIG